ncbi:Asp23/Gls24 family envelope stress response protein [Pseudonocardia spirodelae]|uniref:Asp23/Gls24 family envelope stress response protein n=1 Tax=Pseudonocardia spirodelae TaxID=3133431 RepID=A0ABU8T534_9PSEU
MALEGTDRVEPLACGRDAADVWDHAEAGTLDEHERTCPHCVRARADHDRLGGLVARMAAEPLRPPPSVLEQVMGAVVADLRPHELLHLGPDAWLGRPTAEAALRHVVDTMDGLRARRCRIEQDRVPDGVGGVGAAPVWVRMTVAARFGVDLASVTARVRQMLISAGDRTLGVPITGVDILVEDLWEEPA